LKLSVIIPGINEEDTIPQVISSVQSDSHHEIIYVDGGSEDSSPHVAGSLGAKVATSLPGRAKQLNMGADLSSGDTLLFLHADSLLPSLYSAAISSCLQKNLAGAFSLKFQPTSIPLTIIESLANLRSRLFGLPYGDQGLFLKKDSFQALEGFRDMPLLEDLDLVRRIKQNGELETVGDKIVTSSRRYQDKGPFTTSLTNQFILLAWKAGWSEDKLADLYRGTERR